MIPSVNNILTTELEITEESSKNYKMDLEQNTIVGVCDGLEAMKQVVFKILNTERYAYVIYSWNYGVELRDLYGEPVTYVCPELQRRITEALLQDNRILSVDGFKFDTSGKKTVRASFTVHTVFGDVESEKEVVY